MTFIRHMLAVSAQIHIKPTLLYSWWQLNSERRSTMVCCTGFYWIFRIFSFRLTEFEVGKLRTRATCVMMAKMNPNQNIWHENWWMHFIRHFVWLYWTAFLNANVLSNLTVVLIRMEQMEQMDMANNERPSSRISNVQIHFFFFLHIFSINFD